MSQNADLKSNVQKLTGSNAVPQMPHLFSGTSQGSSCRGLGDKEGFLHESRMSLGNIVMLVFLQVLLCGGDRVRRHNRLRSIVAARARAAGLTVEVEKAGLLPLRPEDDGVDAGGRGAGQRRPADVWVAQWGLHGAAAFDIAVTSGLRAVAVLAESTRSGSAAVEAYEARKRTYLHT